MAGWLPAVEDTHMFVPSPARARLWRIAQLAGVGLTLVLLAGLVLRPDATLTILWSLVIPLVPASLLVAPQLWRNVCPLATLNMASNGLVARRNPSPRLLAGAAVVGMALLVILVPARRVLFNTDATMLAVTIAAVAVLALVLGAVFEAKSGFCNALCPVLPVERLYGQAPFVELSNPRCDGCTHCSVKGCIDLAPAHAIAPVVKGQGASRPWFWSAFGTFAAGFPGFVFGYYLVPDGPLTSAPLVYGTVAAASVASWLLTLFIASMFRVSARAMMPVLAAAAAGVYYWFASPILAETLLLGAAGRNALRVVFLGLVAVWLFRAMGMARDRMREPAQVVT
jgi:hypothetical protein